jgi:hypothetical protein
VSRFFKISRLIGAEHLVPPLPFACASPCAKA